MTDGEEIQPGKPTWQERAATRRATRPPWHAMAGVLVAALLLGALLNWSPW